MSRLRLPRVCLIAVLGLVLTRPVGDRPPATKPALRDATGERATSRTVSPSAFPKWTATMRREVALREAWAPPCPKPADPACAPARWWQEGSGPSALLEEINGYVNRTRYRPDKAAWGIEDYWASPAEFFERGGDCEDYAIAKYYILKSLGIPAQAMRIVVLNDRRRKLSHAVLVVRLGSRDIVLDNRAKRPLSWRDVPHYRPLYAVNERSYWVHLDAGTTRFEIARSAPAAGNRR